MILLEPKDTTIIVIFTQDWGLQLLPWAHMGHLPWGWVLHGDTGELYQREM